MQNQKRDLTSTSTFTIGKKTLKKAPMKKMQRSFPTALLLSLLIFLLSPELIPICEAVWLNIPHTGSKCVSEEIQTNVVVLTDYIVISDEHSINPTVSVKVSIFDSNYEILNLELYSYVLGNFMFIVT